MHWLLLTLASAFSLATADAATKRWLSAYSPGELMLVRFAWCGALLAPLLLVLQPPALPAAFWMLVAALVPLELLAMLLYMRAICTAPLWQTLPYLAFTPAFSAASAWLLLGETVTAGGLAGVLLVVAGAWLLNLPRTADGRPATLLAPWRALLHAAGPRLMLAVALLYSVTSALGKAALQYVPPVYFGALYFAVLAMAALAVLSVRRPATLRVLWRHPGRQLVVGIAMAAMVLSHFVAISHVEVAYMIAVKRSSALFGIAYGALLFAERDAGAHLAAASLMLAGVFVIAAAAG